MYCLIVSLCIVLIAKDQALPKLGTGVCYSVVGDPLLTGLRLHGDSWLRRRAQGSAGEKDQAWCTAVRLQARAFNRGTLFVAQA